jgi:23S rRNA pseudouridine1911/1915/1917 synthase
MIKKKLFYKIVPLISNGHRLDKFLQSQLSDLSRTKLQDLIRDGNVSVNNKIIKESSKKIKEKDEVKVNFPPPKEIYIKANKIPLDIMYEDNDIILINKSPGVVVHPGAGNYENTLVNGLLSHCQNQLSSVGGEFRPGIVHRIDKDTSGVIVVAKNDFAHIKLSKQFSSHTIKRTYEALVWGSLKPSKGIINENISRSIKNRQLMAVRKDLSKGKNAITNYKTLEIFKNLNLPKISLIECKLETGRTHQIRVHMNFKGNPILGDKSYGKSKKKFKDIDANIEKKINNFDRQALHAKHLGFIHPTQDKEVFFEAKRPKDFDILIKSLKKASI